MFSDNLNYGKVGESLIANWFRRKGFSILPVYELEIDSGKGPRLFTPGAQLIAPDMLAIRTDRAIWIEAKHKNAFTWHRITETWNTGINLPHYIDYCTIADHYSPFPVWLLFLHEGGQAKDSPPDSPSGLFGHTLDYLRLHEHHKFGGMVYWEHSELKKIATLADVKGECDKPKPYTLASTAPRQLSLFEMKPQYT